MTEICFTAMASTSPLPNLQKVIHHGWMTKQGNFRRSWKKRFCRLQANGILSYFGDEKNLKNSKKGDLNIFQILEIRPNYDESIENIMHFGFELVSPARVWRFCCKSKIQRDEWVNKIEQRRKALSQIS